MSDPSENRPFKCPWPIVALRWIAVAAGAFGALVAVGSAIAGCTGEPTAGESFLGSLAITFGALLLYLFAGACATLERIAARFRNS